MSRSGGREAKETLRFCVFVFFRFFCFSIEDNKLTKLILNPLMNLRGLQTKQPIICRQRSDRLVF